MIKHALSFLSLLTLGLCQSETYYSYKAYEVSYDMLNTPFYKYQSEIINQDNIVISLNALGQFDSPDMVDSILLKNDETLTQVNTSVKNPIIFTLFFSEAVKIDEMNMILNGYHEDTSLVKKVYVNPTLSYNEAGQLVVDGQLIYRGNQASLLTLSYPYECTGLAIVFENLQEQDEVILQRFTIDQYQVKKHQYWTKDYIENTDTYQYESCIDTASFYPDGNNTFTYDAISEFQIKKRVFETYSPKLTTTTAHYDYLRGNTIQAYSQPDLSSLDEYSQFIEGYISIGVNNPYMSFLSYGLVHDFYPYILKNENQAVRYLAYPVYWSQTSGLDNYIYTSTNSGWCLHTTGSGSTPCYKYQGHSLNSRLNSYDVLVRTYEELIGPDEETYHYVQYYLNDQLKGTQTLIEESEALESTFYLNQSGIYTIEAHIYDILNQKKIVESNPFYIDQDPPLIQYSPNGSHWENQEITVDISIEDELSLVKGYSIQVNDTFYTGKKITLDEEGIYQIKTIAYDYVLNTTKSISDSYYLDFTNPVIEIETHQSGSSLKVIPDIYDALSGLSKWRYSFLKDGETIFVSQWFEIADEMFEYQIEEDVTLYIEAYDQAGNKGEFQKNIYKKLSLTNMGMFAKSYDKEEENLVWLNLQSENDEPLKVEAFMEDEMLWSDTMTLDETTIFSIPYYCSEEMAKIRLCISNENSEEELILNMVAKSLLYQEATLIDLSSISASSIALEENQIDYYETLKMSLEPLEDNYLQGQGLEIKVNVDYFDPCYTYDGTGCIPIDILQEEIYLVIDNGASPIKDDYLKNDMYQVPLANNESEFLLNEVYVSLKKGEVYASPPSENYLSGGNKWYLSPSITLQEHPFIIEGKMLGHNEFHVVLLGTYTVGRSINNLYQVRYINPYDPYFEDESKWDLYKDWFNGLS